MRPRDGGGDSSLLLFVTNSMNRRRRRKKRAEKGKRESLSIPHCGGAVADFYRVRRPRGCLIAKLQNTKYSKSSCKQVINWRPTVNDLRFIER